MSKTPAMPSSEWSSTYSGDPPQSLEKTIASVVSLVETIPLSRDRSGAVVIPDRPRVVSIFGKRGTGKSTILYFSADALRKEGYNLVLPVIDPESFAPGDSLAGWVLAHLERTLSQGELAYEVETSDGKTIEQLLEELRRAQAVRSGEYLPGLGRQGLGFDDFARDAVKIPAHGIRMAERLSLLMDAIADARSTSALKLVVAVDDADLFPELVPGIVSDAQMLGSSARVSVLFAADPRTLAQSLQIGYLSTHRAGVEIAMSEGLLDSQDVRELTSRRLVKHFPRSRRVRLLSLSPEERLAFRPLGAESNRDILETLAEFSFGAENGRSLADLFVIRSDSGEQIAISPYAQALSDNARELRQLHEALELIDDKTPYPASQALAVVMLHGLDGLEFDVPDSVMNAIRLEIIAAEPRPIAEFDFRAIDFSKSMLGGTTIYARSSDIGETDADEIPEKDGERLPLCERITIRSIDKHDTHLAPETNSGPSSEPDELQDGGPRPLPQQYSYLAFLAWEAAQGPQETSLFEMKGYLTRIDVAGGSSWRGLISGDYADVSWSYWRLPQWEEYSDYFTYQAGWDRLVGAVRHSDINLPANDTTLLDLALLVHLDLIATVQAHRSVPQWITELSRDGVSKLIDSPESIRGELRTRVSENLENAFTGASNPSEMRGTDFLTWFATELPLAATPLLATGPMSDWVIELWKKHASPGGRAQCASRIAQIAGEHITGSMADGDILLLEMVEEPGEGGRDPGDSQVERLRSVRNQYRHEQVTRQAEVARTMEAAQIPSELIAEVRETGATRQVLLALVHGGVPPELVTMIAQAFPPPSLVFESDVKQGPLRGTAAE